MAVRLVPTWGSSYTLTPPESPNLLLLEPPEDHLFFSPPLHSPPLGRCEVLEPGWPKMSSAGAVSKKRKKPETKPQSQINKCLNEKRRREQENIYIEELAELISASFADMSSLAVKPDKCAILQETVNQIRHITQEKVSATCDAVQQGEVSSSKPTYLNDDVYGSLVLEALEAFMFVVSPEGKVERVSGNVDQFIKYNQEEVLGKSIYNIIHHGDHARFSSCLLPMSVGWTPEGGGGGGGGVGCGAEAGASGSPTHHPSNKVFNCRFLIKPPDDHDETMEEKQQRVSKYETMQIFSKQVPYKGGFGSEKEEEICEGDQTGPCLMCIARRVPPNEKHMGTPIEQFTMKLDTGGKIIGIDMSGVSATYSQFLNKDLMNRSIEELCHPHDTPKLSNHLKEAIHVGQSTSPIYRLRISGDKHVNVHTKSKLFKAAISNEPEFIMATHSIIGDNDLPIEANSPLSIGGQSSSAVGGPLLGNSMNGGNGRSAPSVTSTDLANTITLNNSSAYQSVTLNSSELGFEFEIFPSSTWDLMGNASNEERGWDQRPESRQSLTQAESPLNNAYGGAQASPAAASGAFTPASTANFTPASTAFPFSPLPEGDEPKERKDDSSGEGGESARLRNLLMTKRTSSTDSQGDEARNKILKGLLNQDDEESPPSQKTNNMLLKLLNEKSDDDDVEARAGLKKQSELLQQLLKEDESNHEEGASGSEDPLLKSLGFRTGGGSPGEGRGRKRPSEEGDESSAKRGSNSLLDSVPSVPPVSSSATGGSSKLWEKNRMLASLLAKQPSTPKTIPPIPASVISATPQDKLPRLKQPPQPPGWSGGTMQQGVSVSQAGRVSQRSPAPVGRTPPSYPQQQQASWDAQLSDPLLSDILDQVIEIEPDHVADNNPGLMTMINALESPSSGNTGGSYSNDMNEKLAISAIQKSLMQCETVVKNPPFSNSPMGQQQQAQPQHQQGQQFPPPPMYQQRQRFPPQSQLRQNQYNLNQQEQQQQLLLQQQKNKTIQQQKQRLLQLQQQQQLLIPSNAAASSTDPGLHNIDSLINNTVAPNVSLQRSTSVPDSQLSPVGGFGVATSGPISGASQISPGQRQPYSPQPFSPVNGGMNSFQSGGGQGGGQSAQSPAVQARLSPSGLPNFQQAQLSPRVSQGQQGYPSSAGGQNTSWSQQQASRLSLQQQQNPMLNAQLTQGGGGGYGGGGGRGGFVRGQLPPVRSLTSPGSRASPFPPELSPTTAASYQFRVQRAPLPPQATTQLPGGLRQYPGGQHKVGGDVLMSPGYHPQQVVSNMYDTPNQQLLYTDHHQLHLYATIPRHPTPTHPPGGNNGMTEYVRQELRAMVGARTNATSNAGSPRQQLQLPPSDLEALGLSFEMPSGVSDSPKMWGNMGEMGSGSPQPGGPPQRNSVEEVSRSGEKASLLQKLLSE